MTSSCEHSECVAVYSVHATSSAHAPVHIAVHNISCVRWLQVAAALDWLHRHPLYVSNRDVKCSNVLIMSFVNGIDNISRPSVTVADFGFADMNDRKTRLGTIGCIAPEIFWKKCASTQLVVVHAWCRPCWQAHVHCALAALHLRCTSGKLGLGMFWVAMWH